MSASWQLRLADRYVRTVVRRESWGNPTELARRARKMFGAPLFWTRARSFGLDVTPVDRDGIRGEWIEPRNALPGAILYIHGGGYVACSPRTHRPVTAALARLTRRKVFSVDYRLAPENRFPAAFDDSLSAYRWVLEQVRFNAANVVMAGDSAGGGLVLASLIAARDAGDPLPSSAVLFSPWTDMIGVVDPPHPNVDRCAMFAPANIADFANAYLGDASRRDVRASPAFADLSSLPPILFQVGDTELLVEDSRIIHERIRQTGGSSELELWPHVFHGWQMLDGLVPEARQALERSAAFILSNLGSPSPGRAGGKPRTPANIRKKENQPTN